MLFCTAVAQENFQAVNAESFNRQVSTKGGPGSEAFETEFSGNRRVDWVAPEPDSLLAGRLLGSKTALDLGWRANGDWAG